MDGFEKNFSETGPSDAVPRSRKDSRERNVQVDCTSDSREAVVVNRMGVAAVVDETKVKYEA